MSETIEEYKLKIEAMTDKEEVKKEADKMKDAIRCCSSEEFDLMHQKHLIIWAKYMNLL